MGKARACRTHSSSSQKERHIVQLSPSLARFPVIILGRHNYRLEIFRDFFEKCCIDQILQTSQKRNSKTNGRLTQTVLVCSQNLFVTVSMWTPWLQDTLSISQKDGGTLPIHFSLSNISFIIEPVCKLTSLSCASTTATTTIFVFLLPAKFVLPMLQ